MLSSKFILFQISIVVLLMMTFTMTNIAPPPTSFIDEISQIEDDEVFVFDVLFEILIFIFLE